MTVSNEVPYAERSWTGVETSFNPSFSAEDVSHVVVEYLDAAEAITVLTRGVHFNVTLGAQKAVTVTPLALPAAPGTLLISRETPATQETTFANLSGFPAEVHERLSDRTMRLTQELRRDLERQVGPWTIADGVVNFQPYQLAAADPTQDGHVATQGWVLEVTGILSLQEYVDDAEAARDEAVAAETGAETAETAAEAARDKGELWAEQTEDTPVEPGAFSAKHWAAKANAAAAAAEAAAGILENPDYGTFSEVATEFADYGSTWT